VEKRIADRVLHVADAGSKNGTFVDGTPLERDECVPIRDGTVLRLGKTVLVYREKLQGGLSAAPPFVRLPNSDRGIVDDAKVRDYLLSSSHPVGRFKSAFFTTLGFSPHDWPALRDALLAFARTADATPGKPSPFGPKFEIRAILVGPSGRQAPVVTIWMIPDGQDFAHFVTAFPG
jgi:hypothetical protein